MCCWKRWPVLQSLARLAEKAVLNQRTRQTLIARNGLVAMKENPKII